MNKETQEIQDSEDNQDNQDIQNIQDNQNNVNFIETGPSINWDEYFMLQAMTASFRSKDPSTKVGAVFVDKNKHQITMGYNGFVAGIDEQKLPWGKDKSAPLEYQKYGYVVHAEANAIIHSTRPLEGSIAYVTLFPCHECAKLMASSKVSKVIFLSNKDKESESHRIARKIFDLSGIEYEQFQMKDNFLSDVEEHFRKITKKI